MFDKWLKLPAHYYLRITALVILTVGVCLHNTLMSIGAIWIIANWLIEADFINYWKKFKKSPTIWMLLGILFLGLLSLMWSDDVAYGQKDLARKLPFFAIPFALGLGKPVEQKVVNFLLFIFIGILLLTSGINFYRYHFVLDDPGDIRNMSYFISHVRFSILIVLGIFVGVYLILKKKGPWWLWVIAVAWLLFYLSRSQILNGYVLLVVLAVFSWIYALVKMQSKVGRLVGTVSLVAIAAVVGWKFSIMMSTFEAAEEVSFSDLEEYSPGGRKYTHDTNSTLMENGNYVWIYVQDWEVAHEWNKRSDFHYYKEDKKGQPMYGTILRYMTSKNLRKDSTGVWSLTDEEVKLIEDGCTSITMNTGLKGKMHEFLHQYHNYKNGGDPNGQSLLQRMEHFRVAWHIISKSGFSGVGIGDVPRVFDSAYAETDSLLSEENRHRSHNQFLTMLISLGLAGLLMFISMMLIPLIKRKSIDYLQLVVFITLFVSCLFQDLLETQAGVTLFGLFYGITVYKEDQSTKTSSKS